MWARQSYRFSPMDFEANAKEGVGVPWPVTYDEIAPWYDKVEIFAGISGSVEGLPQLPDGKFLPPQDLNCVESRFQETLADKLGRKLIIGRCANLTAPLTHNESPQRGTCQCAQPVHPRLSVSAATSAASRRRCPRPNAPAT